MGEKFQELRISLAVVILFLGTPHSPKQLSRESKVGSTTWPCARASVFRLIMLGRLAVINRPSHAGTSRV